VSPFLADPRDRRSKRSIDLTKRGAGNRFAIRHAAGLEATMTIAWRRDVEAVLSEAQAQQRHVLLDFSAAPL
jgi:hypothetical protein